MVNSKYVYHLIAFLVVAIWGSTFVVTKLLLLAGLSPAMIFTLRFIIAYALLLGLITMIPYFIIYPEWPPLSTLLEPQTMAELLFLGAIASTLCFYLWGLAIRGLGVVVATNYVYFNPVVAILCAWIVLSETITPWFLLGTVLILVGMYFADKKTRGNESVRTYE